MISFLLIVSFMNAQEKFLTKQGFVSFFSTTLIEDITADNHQVLSIIDTENGSIAVAILMKSFMFEKSLMQEHFNENYVESDKYPKAVFKGWIEDFDQLDTGHSQVYIGGNITLHGVTQELEIIAEIVKWEDQISIKATFPLAVADFDIKIPKIVTNNIARTIDVTLNTIHKPYKRK